MATPAPTLPDATAATLEANLNFPDNRLLIDLCGEFDRNLTHIESALGVQIVRRDNGLSVLSDEGGAPRAVEVLQELYNRLELGGVVEAGEIDASIRMGGAEQSSPPGRCDQKEMFADRGFVIRTRKKTVEPRSVRQNAYVQSLFCNELVFGLGPAGTGKTYLAVAVAVSLFIEGRVDRILLSRPAVEAGERLGFLPGDMKDKVDPYMQPLYDALNDFLPAKQVAKLIEEKRIEIAPLAFMRGRTLSNAFIVLDEAQNATTMQMKMFLTRMGQDSQMAITGDTSQVDLPRGVPSGLIEAQKVLKGIEGIGMTTFKVEDVVRHPMVARIIQAYDQHAKSND